MRIPRSAVAGIVSPAIPGRMGALMMSLLYQFDQTQWLPPEELFFHQAGQLRLLFAHAASTVPFYKERFAAAGVDPEAPVTRESFARLPILKRADLQGAGDAISTTDLPEAHGKRHPVETSGSTGRAVRMFGTELTGTFWRACVMREHLWQQRNFEGKLAAIRWARKGVAMPPLGVRGDSWGPASGSIYTTGPAALLNIASELHEQVAWLQREDPDYLISFPSNLMALAIYCMERKIGFPKLKQLMTVGETVTDQARDLARQAWNVEIKDSYSCEEAGYLAVQCPVHEVYHTQSESVLLEVVDDEGRPCVPGEIGRVLVTTLHNFATPLIRYEVGDYAEAGAPCACGRGLPVIRRILGRQRNRLVLSDGTTVFPYFGNHDDYKTITPEVLQFQFIQHSIDEIEKRMVVSSPLTPEQEEKTRELMVRNLGYPFRITLTYVDEISAGSRGKYEEFISKVEEQPGTDRDGTWRN